MALGMCAGLGSLLGSRLILRWAAVCVVYCLRLPKRLVVVEVVMVWMGGVGLGGARHRKPCGRWVGQWCQWVGGSHGQHHV